MISFESKGSFKNSENFLNRILKRDYFSQLNKFGEEGCRALSNATPMDSGLTASSWRYQIRQNGRHYTLSWHNTNTRTGVPVAILIQYGHGTGTGGYVAGRDYINPVIRPLFEKIADAVWKEVTRR